MAAVAPPDPAAAGIHRLSLPTPFMVGRVNVYLIEDDPLTLVDAGPNSGKALDELEQALAARGHRVEDLQRIVITHQHMDHLGLVGILARRSGAEVCALDALAPVVEDFNAYCDREDEYAEGLMRLHGIPVDVASALRTVSLAFRAWGGSAPVDTPLADGGSLEFAGRVLKVHHRPGHSPSDTVFADEERGILLSGDHLIKHISSNPMIAFPLDGDTSGRPKALKSYLESLARTREMPAELILPGHGEPVTDHAPLIEERFRMHERRMQRIAKVIAERPRSAYEIAQDLWGNVAVTQAYLTLSEVLGHVDLLLDRGEVVEEESDGVIRFAPAA
jgi:glyoxylase-like metal-dependent hydrolase (beta-lactamase superfamily II)